MSFVIFSIPKISLIDASTQLVSYQCLARYHRDYCPDLMVNYMLGSIGTRIHEDIRKNMLRAQHVHKRAARFALPLKCIPDALHTQRIRFR